MTKIYFKFPDTRQGILPDCANKWAALWIMSLAVEEGQWTGEMMVIQAGGVWIPGETAAAVVCQRLKGSEQDGRKLKGEKGNDIRIGMNLEKCRCVPKQNPKTFLRFLPSLSFSLYRHSSYHANVCVVGFISGSCRYGGVPGRPV